MCKEIETSATQSRGKGQGVGQREPMPAIKEADSAAEAMNDLYHFHGRRATVTAHLDGSRVVVVVDGL